MNIAFNCLGVVAVVATVAAAPFHTEAGRPRKVAAPACATDSNYQRLSFWVGDWDVFDSTGNHYATQRVRAVIDACAVTAEWTGRVGDKGMSMSAFDGRTGEWKQVYASNQVPTPLGVLMRTSDSSYHGAGIRFVPPDGDLARTRVTILPLSDHRAMQVFDESRDGGKSWRTVFKAEHRPARAVE